VTEDEWLHHLETDVPAKMARQRFAKEMNRRRHFWTRHKTTTLSILGAIILALGVLTIVIYTIWVEK
jgi:hypothetical protein